MLELNELLDIFNAGDALVMDEEAADACNYYSIEAQKITCELNYNFHDFDERRELFSKLIGKELDEEFRVFTPFFTDFGKKFTLVKMSLSMQDASSKIKVESILGMMC